MRTSPRRAVALAGMAVTLLAGMAACGNKNTGGATGSAAPANTEAAGRAAGGRLVLDPATRSVRRDGAAVSLSPKEFALLHELMRRLSTARRLPIRRRPGCGPARPAWSASASARSRCRPYRRA